MVESWVLWLFIVGVAVGVVAALVVTVRLPRQEDDVGDLERPAEAEWISSVIERHGGIAPASLVEEVLDLHQAYLRDPRLARPPIGVAGGIAYPVMGESPMQPPIQAPVQVPGYPTGQAPGYAGVRVPGYAGVQAPGYAPANGPSGPLVDPPGGTPTGEPLDRQAR